MKTPRMIARTVGILFILGTTAGIGSAVALAPASSPDYLTTLAGVPDQIEAGALLVLVMGAALAPIPALLYPILKRKAPTGAMGYAIFRTIEVVSFLGFALFPMLLLWLSRRYVIAIEPDLTCIPTLGALVRAANGLLDPIITLFSSLAAMILYATLYRARLVPRWLSGWGFVGGALHLLAGGLHLFGVHPAGLDLVLTLPIALQEMVFAVWLIVKGFNPQTLEAL